jgi:hypothetical protein
LQSLTNAFGNVWSFHHFLWKQIVPPQPTPPLLATTVSLEGKNTLNFSFIVFHFVSSSKLLSSSVLSSSAFVVAARTFVKKVFALLFGGGTFIGFLLRR